MGRSSNKKAKPENEFVLFDVLYEDGSKRSNRRVPGALLGGLDGDEPARGAIEEEDRKLGEISGNPRPAIKSITRSAVR
ncbi:MAG TPA: hypothetical protein VK196_12695 [Magnetospirillum sp.]|nr:hypothetical protein [Magnetospirillum sp.]